MRIVTRPDFDGIVCAVLLSEAEEITEPVWWLEPGDVQSGLADIGSGDILANLPYDDRCGMWFDHHVSNRIDRSFRGVFRIAPSAAGIIFAHYRETFGRDYAELVAETDRIDSAGFSEEEVLHPENNPYILLSMTVRGTADNEADYWNRLVGLLRLADIQTVIADAEVRERCEQTMEENAAFGDLLEKHTSVVRQVSITDFRSLDRPPRGNRFLVYSLYPGTNVNACILHREGDRRTIRLKIGHSILNSTCKVNIGKMLARFGGGGHQGAGSCSFPVEKADERIKTIIDLLVANGQN